MPDLITPVHPKTEPSFSPPIGKGVDPLVLAYYLLMEASSTTAHAAVLHAKQLQKNALSQELLNDEIAKLQWNSVPHLQTKIHTKTVSHMHWTWNFWTKGFGYKTYQHVVWSTHPNQAVVNNAEAQNQRVAGLRQIFENKMNSLQQLTQSEGTTVNSLADEAMQTMQEGTNLLQILKSLTYQALLRHPPQG